MTDTFNNRYDIIRQIGVGGFGVVYLALSKYTKNTVAVKVVPITIYNENRILQEVISLDFLSMPNCSPYVSCYYDHFIDRTRGELIIEMEYVLGPDVFMYTQLLRDASKDQRNTENTYLLNLTGRRLLKAMLLALKYIHDRNIIHNDIKPTNIVVSESRIPILVDFGISCFAQDATNKICQMQYGKVTDKCCINGGGTSLYMSPESIYGIKYKSSDLWSLGATVYTVITGNNIWSINLYQTNPMALMEQVAEKFRNRTLPNRLNTNDATLNSIVNNFLTYDVSSRMSIDQAMSML